MTGNKQDQYGRDIDSWLQSAGGRVVAGVIAVLVIWGLVVVFG